MSARTVWNILGLSKNYEDTGFDNGIIMRKQNVYGMAERISFDTFLSLHCTNLYKRGGGA